jgi:radical SAM-linked protein
VAEGFRLRVCYRKTGRLRHLSHLETIRACERAVRRAALPYAVSQGFTPRMKIAFGPALPVGTAGEREYFDLTLTRFVPVAEVLEVLGKVTVADVGPVACGYVPAQERSLAAALTIAVYDVEMEGGIPHDEVESALRALLRSGTLDIDHKGKHKVFDLAEVLPKEPEVSSDGDAVTVRFTIRMGERGSLRPDTVIAAALGRPAVVKATRVDLFAEREEGWLRPL